MNIHTEQYDDDVRNWCSSVQLVNYAHHFLQRKARAERLHFYNFRRAILFCGKIGGAILHKQSPKYSYHTHKTTKTAHRRTTPHNASLLTFLLQNVVVLVRQMQGTKSHNIERERTRAHAKDCHLSVTSRI